MFTNQHLLHLVKAECRTYFYAPFIILHLGINPNSLNNSLTNNNNNTSNNTSNNNSSNNNRLRSTCSHPKAPPPQILKNKHQCSNQFPPLSRTLWGLPLPLPLYLPFTLPCPALPQPGRFRVDKTNPVMPVVVV